MSFIGNLRSAFRAFRHDRAGNFAMLAAILAVPVVGAAGLAIDYATMSRLRVQLQQALDAAVLAVAQRGNDISDDEAQRIAAAYLTGNLTQAYRDMAVLRDGTSVTLKAETPAPLAFGGLFGYDSWPINASSTADMAFASYEVALVLDTTGSMRGGKLQAMKDAVIGLIDDLSSRVNDKERLKFALVPFSSFVNVGPQHGPRYDRSGRRMEGTGAEWLDIEGRSAFPQIDLQQGISRFDLYKHLGQEWAGCVETRLPAGGRQHDVDDTPVVQNDPSSLFVPAFAIDEPDWGSFDNSYLAYPGGQRETPLDGSQSARALRLLKYGIQNAALDLGLDPQRLLGGNRATSAFGWLQVNVDFSRGKGPNKNCYAQPITPLTNNYADLKRKVRAFQAEGNTNIMEGVAWGMRVLSPQPPFTEGRDKKDVPNLEKVMIVLTDGANVFGNKGNAYGSTYSSFGFLADGRLNGMKAGSASATNRAMNEKTLQACRNAKEKGYTIYTIRLEEPDVATGNLLRDCASSPDRYFDTPSRGQLDGVFKEIRDGITKLRLSS